MALLTDGEIANLKIERMIFHVVRPDQSEPIFLEEVSPPQQVEFFIERIKETMKGASYIFKHGAGTAPLLFDASHVPDEEGVSSFIGASQALARRFKETVGDDKRYAPGVLMLFQLEITGERLVSIIKYEHQKVVHWELKKDANGRMRPNLESFIDTFTQDRKSMQKSAVVRFDVIEDAESPAQAHRLAIIDHAGRYRDATQHFSNFLDIKRELELKDMTRRLYDAVVETAESHKDDLDPVLGRSLRRRVRDAMDQLDGFDHEKPEEFLNSVFGGLPADSPIHGSFKRSLVRKSLGSEGFAFDRQELPKRSYKRLVTGEGIAVYYKPQHEKDGLVQVDRDKKGGAKIVLKTANLVVDDETDTIPKTLGIHV